MSVHGILNVRKAIGWSSFDVVAVVRRLSGVRRVGHAGTLDPAAEGVLPICLGQATRVIEYLVELPKTYRAGIRLGVSTDTFDGEGTVTATADASGVTGNRIEEALAAFRGQIEQVPPMYSALKHEGVPLYRYARAGQTVERKARPVMIHRLDMLDFEPPVVSVELECGRGAYVRTLADDLGRMLGCGAYLESLARTAMGPFSIEQAVDADSLRSTFQGQRWRELLYPLDAPLTHWLAAILGEENERRTRSGRTLDLSPVDSERVAGLAAGTLCRAYSLGGYLIAVLRYQGQSCLWQPAKVFAPPPDDSDALH
jgi:tRNA pseudouridine55 synthase